MSFESKMIDSVAKGFKSCSNGGDIYFKFTRHSRSYETNETYMAYLNNDAWHLVSFKKVERESNHLTTIEHKIKNFCEHFLKMVTAFVCAGYFDSEILELLVKAYSGYQQIGYFIDPDAEYTVSMHSSYFNLCQSFNGFLFYSIQVKDLTTNLQLKDSVNNEIKYAEEKGKDLSQDYLELAFDRYIQQREEKI